MQSSVDVQVELQQAGLLPARMLQPHFHYVRELASWVVVTAWLLELVVQVALAPTHSTDYAAHLSFAR